MILTFPSFCSVSLLDPTIWKLEISAARSETVARSCDLDDTDVRAGAFTTAQMSRVPAVQLAVAVSEPELEP